MKHLALFLLTLLLAPLLFAQEEEEIKKITVDVDYDRIGYYDVVNVTYSYNGKDCKTYTVDFTDFEVVKGPVQHHYTDIKKHNGKVKPEETYAFAYTLRPLSMGMLEIPSMLITTDRKRTIRSKVFEIEVVAGKIIKAPEPEVQKTLLNNSSDIVIGANNASGQFLVSTGPVYKTTDKSKKQRVDSFLTVYFESVLMKAVKTYTRCTKLGTWYWNDMPRNYFVVADTTAILTILQKVHSNSSKEYGVVYSSHVFKSKTWNAMEELMMLEGKEKLYRTIQEKAKAVLKQQSMPKMETLSVTVHFRSAEEAEKFSAKIHKEKCTVSNVTELTATGAINNGKFSTTITKALKPTEAEMMAFAKKAEVAADESRGCIDAVSVTSTP